MDGGRDAGRTWQRIRRRPEVFGLPSDPAVRVEVLVADIVREAVSSGHELELTTGSDGVTVVFGPEPWLPPDRQYFYALSSSRVASTGNLPYPLLAAIVDVLLVATYPASEASLEVLKPGARASDVERALRAMDPGSGEAIGFV